MAKTTKQDCVGCRNNFYNGNNDLGVQECWSFKNAKTVNRYCISIHTPTYQENFYKVRKPRCYNCQGYYYTDSIKNYPKKNK